MNIIICGLPASGKTTIGKMLASHLHWNFVDTDWLIEKAYLSQTGHLHTCRQIYVNEGAAFFRMLEKEQVVSLQNYRNTIIAIGGGTISDPEIKRILLETGSVIYLKTQPQTIWERLKVRGLPSYLTSNDPETEFLAIAATRIPTYESMARTIIEADFLAPHEIIAKIFEEGAFQ